MLSLPFAERKAERVARLRQSADSLAAKSDTLYQAGRAALDLIPFGQPMMPDHHSYKADRSYRDRNKDKISKSFELADKAAHLEKMADNAEAHNIISSDDPEAVAMLTEKLATLEGRRAAITKANAEARKAKAERPYPEYVSANLSGNIKSVKDRIKLLTTRAELPEFAPIVTEKSTVTLERDINRYAVKFPSKPDADTIKA
ncbi:MAG: DUF3560 domain-containing protein, partial [Sphaerochaeta sp.]|nr:DUF3560 domain-containing protein [Sphaerochaeta sp.]